MQIRDTAGVASHGLPAVQLLTEVLYTIINVRWQLPTQQLLLGLPVSEQLLQQSGKCIEVHNWAMLVITDL